MRQVNERRAEDARLVTASRAGDPAAFPALFAAWFDRCAELAWRILHDRDAAADVAQESFLAAWQGLDRLRDPAAFGGWVLRTTRNRALDRLERDRRTVPVGDDALAAAVDGPPGTDETAAAVTRGEDADLVRAATAALGERDASVLDLHLRHELAVPDIAEALGVTANNAHQILFRLRRRLGGAIRAWVLWRDGEPACDALAGALAAAGVARFGPDTVRVIERHLPGCADCDSRQNLRLAPEALFAAVPFAPVAPDVRARATAVIRARTSPADHPAGPRRHRSGTGRAHPVGAGVLAAVVAAAVAVAAGLATGLAADSAPGVGAGSTAPVAGDGGTGAGGPATTAAPGAPAPPAPTDPGAAGPGGATAAGTGTGTGEQVAAPAGTTPADAGPVTDAEAPPAGGPPATDATTTTTTAPVTTTTSGAPAAGPAPDPGLVPAGEGPGDGDDPAGRPEEPAATPEVLRFAAIARRPAAPCADGERPVALAWEAANGTAAALAGPGAPAGGQPASGSATACAPGREPATFALTVTGPGGTDTATATA
jgi:RNA polymerase sigma factor (sigma-70 family)